MRVLVTGAGGFAGRYLISELARHGHDAFAFDLPGALPAPGAKDNFPGDIRKPSSLRRAIKASAPDACVHLAAISFAPEGGVRPRQMFDVNVTATLNLLEAFRGLAPRATILTVSSSRVYGPKRQERPVREDDPFAPAGIYAITKAAADWLTLSFAAQYGMRAITARPHNHTGPGQSPRFVIASFAAQIRKMRAEGGAGVIKVGNLDSVCYFADVRDVVRAYRLLLEKGRAGEGYNIGSNESATVGSALERMCGIAGVKPWVVMDEEKYRPTDVSPALDISKIKHDTGWEPQIPFSRTLADILA